METYRGIVKELISENPECDKTKFNAIESSSISRAKQLAASKRGLAFAAGKSFLSLSLSSLQKKI